MGVQIHINRKALEKAGWTIEIETEEAVWDDDGQYEIYPEHHYMVITKGDYHFHSYVSDSFVADCNAWGHNKALFEAAGLLDLPHTLS